MLIMKVTCRLLNNMQSCSMVAADTITHWLVLFLRLQARTSWVRVAPSLSAIWDKAELLMLGVFGTSRITNK